jgi:hypothetical protein
LPFLARSFASGLKGIDTFLAAFLYSASLTVFLMLWFLPTLYIFAYTRASTEPVFNFLKRLRHPAMGFVILLAIFAYGGYLFSFPAYDEKWRASLEVNAGYDLRSGENSLRLAGNEYFRNVNVNADTLHKKFDERIHQEKLPVAVTADWAKLSGSESVSPGARDTASVNYQLTSSRQWYRANLQLSADTLEIADVTANVKYRLNKNGLLFSWYYEPPESLRVEAKFTIPSGAKLIRQMNAVYTEPPVPMQVTAELAEVIYRTTVTYRDTLALPRAQTSTVAEN